MGVREAGGRQAAVHSCADALPVTPRRPQARIKRASKHNVRDVEAEGRAGSTEGCPPGVKQAALHKVKPPLHATSPRALVIRDGPPQWSLRRRTRRLACRDAPLPRSLPSHPPTHPPHLLAAGGTAPPPPPRAPPPPAPPQPRVAASAARAAGSAPAGGRGRQRGATPRAAAARAAGQSARCMRGWVGGGGREGVCLWGGVEWGVRGAQCGRSKQGGGQAHPATRPPPPPPTHTPHPPTCMRKSAAALRPRPRRPLHPRRRRPRRWPALVKALERREGRRARARPARQQARGGGWEEGGVKAGARLRAPRGARPGPRLQPSSCPPLPRPPPLPAPPPCPPSLPPLPAPPPTHPPQTHTPRSTRVHLPASLPLSARGGPAGRATAPATRGGRGPGARQPAAPRPELQQTPQTSEARCLLGLWRGGREACGWGGGGGWRLDMHSGSRVHTLPPITHPPPPLHTHTHSPGLGGTATV